MTAITINVNGKQQAVEVSPETPLLWVLRDTLGLTGTKFGCGMAMCGACTVHLNGEAIRSCVTPISSAVGKKITTIEGLSHNVSHPLQVAWVQNNVPQCGYCQSGQIMQAAALLKKKPKPTDDDIDAAMKGNICRCGTYQRIRQAIKQASNQKAGGVKK
jgi:isoquinoline 1-oxidoreductase subunit alpha